MEFENQSYEIKEIYGKNSRQDANQLANVGDTQSLCIVCFSDPIDTIILPCRHLCLCINCAKSLQQCKKYHSKKCPICRIQIESFVRVQPTQNSPKLKEENEVISSERKCIENMQNSDKVEK